MSDNTFLCGSCLSVMCSDCKEIAEEYPELLRIKNQAIAALERRIERLSAELDSEKRRSSGYEEIAKLGLPDKIKRWIDSQVKGGSEDRIRKTALDLIGRINAYCHGRPRGVVLSPSIDIGVYTLERALEDEKRLEEMK